MLTETVATSATRANQHSSNRIHSRIHSPRHFAIDGFKLNRARLQIIEFSSQPRAIKRQEMHLLLKIAHDIFRSAPALDCLLEDIERALKACHSFIEPRSRHSVEPS